MADCGATGSALDRVARSLLGGSQASDGNISKQVASLMGHAAATGNIALLQTPMSQSAPRQLTMPQASVATTFTVKQPAQASAQQQQPIAIGTPSELVSQQPSFYATTQYSQHQNDAMILQHNFHQHPIMAMQQQQQQVMMQMAHQQQQMAHMVKQQQLMIRAQKQVSEHHHHRIRESNEQKSVSLDNWQNGVDKEFGQQVSDMAPVGMHEGVTQGVSMEELAAAWAEVADDNITVGHDGLAQGATIEELAAAWAQAEAEYDSVDAATNLWNDTNDPVYEFLNTEKPERVDQQDWMEQGLREFNAGNLKEAVKAFEIELQYCNGDNSAAWKMLGRCHAENDMDREAIVCLEQAVDRDPYSPEALLLLGVSYVNELNHAKALKNLKAWITHNPKFAGMELQVDMYRDSLVDQESAFDEVQRLLVQALEYDPVDASDVLEAMGVVYNVSRDYVAAGGAFRRALDARPDDYQLWNKLGATLANGNQSQEALPAYHKALQLKPKYARAWLNMAISHSNLQNYDEAARCYLQTLSLNPAAIHCWSYLRIALSCSERWDLIQHAASQNLEAFKDLFDFVIYS